MTNNAILGQDVWTLDNSEEVTLITHCQCGSCSVEARVDSMEFMLHTNALKEYQYKYVDGTLVLEETVEMCKKCTNNSVYAYQLTSPTGFNNVTLYHGLSAFCKDLDIERLNKRVERLSTETGIDVCCCTDAFIGPFGISLVGNVLAASNSDIFSYRDGDRIKIETKYADRLVRDIKQLVKLDAGYDEIIATDIQIKGFWIKKESMKHYYELVKRLAHKYNVEIKIV